MILRRNILPTTYLDGVCLLFVLFIIPCIYCYELFIVLPTYYPFWSFWYNFHFVLGNFVAVNAVTNLVAIILVDTSVKGRMLTDFKLGWRFCPECECIAPPRSWHCDSCRTCILKRDHHCFFTGCCIGHENYRYFMMFCVYIFLACSYCLYFNTFFIWNQINFKSAATIFKLIFPLAMLIYDTSTAQIYLLLSLVVIFGVIFVGILLYYHISLLLKGQISHERNANIDVYNYGTKTNIKMVFGNRWYLTWISPFIISKLPHDGINWDPIETIKSK